MNISEAMIQRLAALGVTYAAGVAGGGIMFLVDAIARSSLKVRYTHHEQAAGLAVEAYSRASSVPAICFATIGPGVGNAVSAALSCYVNSVPAIFISGAKRTGFSTDYSQQRFNFPQDADTQGMVTPVVKKYFRVESANGLEEALDELYMLARSGRPGPVWIDVPLDVQNLDASGFSFKKAVASGKAEQVEFSAPLKAQSRPVVMIGRGCEGIFRSTEFQTFLKTTKLPFITSIGSNHLIEAAGPRNLGFFGPTGRRAANRVLCEADAIIAIGAGLDIDNTGFDRSGFFKGKHVELINADPFMSLQDCCSSWFKHLVDVNVLSFADLTNALNELSNERWDVFSQDVNKLLSVDAEIERNLDGSMALDPYLFSRKLSLAAPTKTAFAGGISLDVHSFSHVASLGSNEFYLSSHCGQLGWDLPAAVGLADTGLYDRVVIVTGDGSLMFNLQELATLRRSSVPVIVVVFDNEGYNSIRTSQETHLKSNYAGSDKSDLNFPDWSHLAAAFEFNFLELSKNQDLTKLPKLFDGKFWFCLARIPPGKGRAPKLVSKIVDGKFVSPTLFDQFPPLMDVEESAYAEMKSRLLC